MTFGEKCKKYRTEQKLTQEEVAAAVGISRRTYINYETGNKLPRNAKTVDQLAAFFGVTPEELLLQEERYLSLSGRQVPVVDRAEQLLQEIREILGSEETASEIKNSFCHSLRQLCEEYHF